MSAKTVFDSTYALLKSIGVVDTKKEFYADWCGTSESYFRCLKHSNRTPSANVMLVCSDKLKHYSKMLNKKADENSKELANNFEHLSNNLQNIKLWTRQTSFARRRNLPCYSTRPPILAW